MPSIPFISRLALAGLLITAAAPAARAQVATPAQAPQTSAPNAVPTAVPTVLQAHANLVLVDVVVSEHGKPVHGLEKSSFHVFEDGHEQAISSFDEHQSAALPPAGAKPPVLPPNTWSNVPFYRESSAVNVLLLDGLNTPVADQMYERRKMLEYMSKIPPGTSMAIFTLSSRLRLIEGFTTDAARLTKALESKKAGPQSSVVLDPDGDSSLTSVVDDLASSGANPEAIEGMQEFMADMAAFQTDLRVRMTVDAMQQLARYLNAIPGRKNLIWFSGSFPISLDPDETLSNPFRGVRNYAEEIQETSQLLSAARVAVYPVDARGLMTPPASSASYAASTLPGGSTSNRRGGGAGSGMSSVAKDNLKFMQQTVAEHLSMKQIAEETGGQEYVNTNGLKEAVEKAVENGSNYYTIGYVPSAQHLEGKFHRIQLRADKGDWKLAYRRGYYADASGKPSSHSPGKAGMYQTATLRGAPPSTQILFQARVLPATDQLFRDLKMPDGPAGEMASALKGPAHRYIADLTIDSRGLTCEEAPEGGYRCEIELALVAYDAEARRVNYVDRSFLLKLKAEQYAQVMARDIPARMALDLPEGPIALRIAVFDLVAGRAGSLEAPLTVVKAK